MTLHETSSEEKYNPHYRVGSQSAVIDTLLRACELVIDEGKSMWVSKLKQDVGFAKKVVADSTPPQGTYYRKPS